MKNTNKIEETKRRNHALRNEQACYYLHESGGFPDWVITTAFYSALQFVKYKIFPLKIGENTFNNLNEYRDYMVTNYDNHGISAHSILKKLLNKNFKNIAAPYNELYDACQNARYVEYEVTKEEVDLALKNLAEIKKFCNTNKPSQNKVSSKTKK